MKNIYKNKQKYIKAGILEKIEEINDKNNIYYEFGIYLKENNYEKIFDKNITEDENFIINSIKINRKKKNKDFTW